MKSFLSFILFGIFLGNHVETEQFVDNRDGNHYPVIECNGLYWLGENLRFKTPNSYSISADCGLFYPVKESSNVCPKNWRLPKEKEVKLLIKSERKKKINIRELLGIHLCGRVDYGQHAKAGEQNTFWIEAPLKNGGITHWHIFQNEHKIHHHNVTNAKRKFPVRCVCSKENF